MVSSFHCRVKGERPKIIQYEPSCLPSNEQSVLEASKENVDGSSKIFLGRDCIDWEAELGAFAVLSNLENNQQTSRFYLGL